MIAAPPQPSLCIPSRTRALPNGMRVVVHEDHASPVVAVHLMIRAGSRDEPPGRTGLAHLLEHLLFEGSLHCPKGDFDRLLEQVGGSNNGSTWLDRTNYYETVPSHAVELALWLERERMAHWLPTLDDAMLETQRGVVVNERMQTVENRPYGGAEERLYQLLFPAPHPYGWPTIGRRPDLDAITLADVREFYRARYAPDSAVLVLAGDVDAEAAWEMAERFFGDLPRGSGAGSPPTTGAPLPGAARDTLHDAVSFPRVYRAYSVPPYGTADWVALDVLAYLLADGESTPLQRALVREGQLAQDVDTYLYPTALRGIWGWTASARSGVEAERLEAAVDGVIREVAERGVDTDAVTGAVRRVRRDQIAELATVEERAEALAYAVTVLGDADAVNRVLDAYAAVTPDDVRRAAAEWLRPEHSATVTVVPRKDDEEADAR